MTPRQLEGYRFIVAFHRANGFAPNYDEICKALNISSRSGAHTLVSRLEAEGLIKRYPGRARGIMPVELLVEDQREVVAKHVETVIENYDCGRIMAERVVEEMRGVPHTLRTDP